jgi:hypothetical protein
MVILGRQGFGPNHARNVLWAIVVYVIAAVAGIALFFIVIFSAIPTLGPNGTNPVNPSFMRAVLGAFSEVGFVGTIIYGISQVLFTYALQDNRGRLLLWLGYVSTVAANYIALFVVNNEMYTSSLLRVVPASLFGLAYYLARERIIRGKTPGPPAVL